MTPEQKPLLVDAGRGFCVYWQERALYPVQDPQKKLIEKVLRTSWQPETLVFIPSPLLYYGIPELLQNLSPQVFLLTYEHEAALRHLSPLPEDPRIQELPALTEESIQNCLKAFGPENVRRVVVLRLSGSVSLHMETYKNIEVKLEEEIQTFWKNRMTALRLGTLWLKNLFKNLPLLARYPALDPRGDETPLVIAGAGPSLELALPILRKHRHKITLVCVDTALPVLTAGLIEPDLVMAVESQHFNLDDFATSFGRNIGLAADLTAHPGTFRMLSGDISFFASRFAPLGLLHRLEAQGILPYPMEPWGSVGVTAVAALGLQETRDVYLTGLDFCFDAEKSHARGSPAHRKLLGSTTRFKTPSQSPSIWSRPFFTGPEFPGYSDGSLRFYAQRLKYILEGKNKVWDVRQGGWNLGIPVLTLEDWSERLNKYHPKMASKPRDVSPTLEKEKVKEFLGSERQRLWELRRLFEEMNQGMETPTLESKLQELDYLYFAFPDGGGKPQMNSSFLSRVKISLSYFLTLIEQTLNRF